MSGCGISWGAPEQVTVVRGRERSTELPAASVDVAFVCDTYHHFEYPRAMLESLRTGPKTIGALTGR